MDVRWRGIYQMALTLIQHITCNRYIMQSKHTAGRNPARVKTLCPMRGPASPDIIMTDIMGLRQFRKFVRGVFHQYRFVSWWIFMLDFCSELMSLFVVLHFILCLTNVLENLLLKHFTRYPKYGSVQYFL